MNSRSFYKNQSGVYAIEFAIVVPILFIILLSVLEYAQVLYAIGTLEGAAAAGARAASVTGDPTQFVTVLKSRGNAAFSGFANANMIMSTGVWNPDGTRDYFCQSLYTGYYGPNCSDSLCYINSCHACIPPPGVTSNNPEGCDGIYIGGPGQIVVYLTFYEYPLYSPLLRAIMPCDRVTGAQAPDCTIKIYAVGWGFNENPSASVARVK